MITRTFGFNLGSKYDLKHVFATFEQEENEFYHPIIMEIDESECRSCLSKHYSVDDKPKKRDKCISLKISGDIKVLLHDDNQLEFEGKALLV